MNTYKNRSRRNPWAGVKPARNVTPEEAEARRMADNIKALYGRNEAWENFMMSRQSGASIEDLRTLHAELTAPAIEAEEALAADWREDQADRLDYARGQF